MEHIDTVHNALRDLAYLDEVEAKLQEMHDRVCGDGMYLGPNESPLGEVGFGIRDNLYSQLGEAVVKMAQTGTKVISLEPRAPNHVMTGVFTGTPVDPKLDAEF